jgi:hypothetical protein
MFQPTTWYRVGCDAPGCIRLVLDHATETPLLIESPDLDRVDAALLTDPDGTPWVRGALDRIACPPHAHLA